MIRTVFGIAIILAGLILKATLNHNIAYWSFVKSSTVFLFIIGLIAVGVPIFEWAEKSKPATFKTSPVKWFLYGVKVIVALVLVVAVAFQLENFGEWSNKKVVEYYLGRETGITEGTILSERKVSYTIKTTRYESFYLVRYDAGGTIVEQGLEPSYSLMIGQTYQVTYSKEFPSIFRVGHRKR